MRTFIKGQISEITAEAVEGKKKIELHLGLKPIPLRFVVVGIFFFKEQK